MYIYRKLSAIFFIQQAGRQAGRDELIHLTSSFPFLLILPFLLSTIESPHSKPPIQSFRHRARVGVSVCRGLEREFSGADCRLSFYVHATRGSQRHGRTGSQAQRGRTRECRDFLLRGFGGKKQLQQQHSSARRRSCPSLTLELTAAGASTRRA